MGAEPFRLIGRVRSEHLEELKTHPPIPVFYTDLELMRRDLQEQRKVMTGEDRNSNSSRFTSSRERINGACRGSRCRAGAGIDGDRVVDEPSKSVGNFMR
jgi:hypothetical protein